MWWQVVAVASALALAMAGEDSLAALDSGQILDKFLLTTFQPTWSLDSKLKLGQVSAVDVDQNGNVHVFHRGSRIWDSTSFGPDNRFKHVSQGPIKEPTRLVLDGKTGALLRSFGASQFYLPHGLTSDKQGNVWLTDVALHQVMKFKNNDSWPTLILGEALVPGSDQKHFCKPTDVAVLVNGEAIFVADGYCNSRIVKFNSSGKYVEEYGGDRIFNEMTALIQLNVPHALALFESKNVLCVADRENQRVVCFLIESYPLSGKVVFEKDNLGRVYGICSVGGQLFGVSTFDDEDDSTLFMIDMDSLETDFQATDIANAHDIASDNDGNLYIGAMNPNQVIKLLNVAP